MYVLKDGKILINFKIKLLLLNLWIIPKQEISFILRNFICWHWLYALVLLKIFSSFYLVILSALIKIAFELVEDQGKKHFVQHF